MPECHHHQWTSCSFNGFYLALYDEDCAFRARIRGRTLTVMPLGPLRDDQSTLYTAFQGSQAIQNPPVKRKFPCRWVCRPDERRERRCMLLKYIYVRDLNNSLGYFRHGVRQRRFQIGRICPTEYMNRRLELTIMSWNTASDGQCHGRRHHVLRYLAYGSKTTPIYCLAGSWFSCQCNLI